MELAKMLLDIADYHPSKINNLAPPLGSPDRRCPDISKLKQLTGYSPKTGLQEGLTKTFHSIKRFTT
jgi:UDP-glucuronate decarboxylase